MVKNPKGTQHRGKNRDYKQEYEAYGGTPKQIKKQVLRVTARREENKAAGHKIPTNMQVDHIKPLAKGGGNAKSNLRVISAKENEHKGDRKA